MSEFNTLQGTPNPIVGEPNATPPMQQAVPNPSVAQPTEPFKAFNTKEEYESFFNAEAKKVREATERKLKVNDGTSTKSYAEIEAEITAKLTPAITSNIKTEMERVAKLTAEEKEAEARTKAHEEIRQEKLLLYKEIALNQFQLAGCTAEDAETMVALVIDDNKDVMTARINEQLRMRRDLEEKIKQQVTAQFQMNNPQTQIGNGSVSELQQQYDSAKRQGNQPMMMRLTRIAQQQNVNLKT